MRLFVAVQLNSAVKEALKKLQSDMRALGVRGSCTREENLHLTIAFIGEWPDPNAVLEALKNVSFDPFTVSTDGAGHFGDLWWAGIEGTEPLNGLAEQIRGALAAADINFDKKRFRPHITLIRRAVWRDDRLRELQVPKVRMTVDRFCLMRSDRGSHGMVYTEIGSVYARPQG